jgi:hypothetical protein
MDKIDIRYIGKARNSFSKGDTMKTKRFWIYGFASVLVCISAFITAATIATERRQLQMELRERLRDSEGVYIFVDVISKDKSSEESLKQQFETDVDQALGDADIETFTKEELETIPGRPRLSLYLVAYEEPSYRDVYLYCFRIAHIEDATLVRSYRYAEGICWDSGHYVGRGKKAAIRQAVKTQLNKYISDYLAANPRKPKRPDQSTLP